MVVRGLHCETQIQQPYTRYQDKPAEAAKAGVASLLEHRCRHHGRHRHTGGDQARLRDESECVLTGLGVILYFFGWLSLVALFVVIVIS